MGRVGPSIAQSSHVSIHRDRMTSADYLPRVDRTKPLPRIGGKGLTKSRVVQPRPRDMPSGQGSRVDKSTTKDQGEEQAVHADGLAGPQQACASLGVRGVKVNRQ